MSGSRLLSAEYFAAGATNVGISPYECINLDMVNAQPLRIDVNIHGGEGRSFRAPGIMKEKRFTARWLQQMANRC